MAFTYIRHIPSPPLDAYIDYLWYDEGRVFPREKLLPRATLHLVLNFGGPIQAYDGARREPLAAYTESWVIGTWSEYHVVNWPRNTQFYGVCFKAGAAYPFLQWPLAELHNQFVALDALWGPFAAEMRERLYAAPTIRAGFELLERLLLARLGEAPHGLDMVRYAVRQIADQHGELSIQALSDHIGISQNHLLTQFKRLVGLPPKGLARLDRLHHVLSSIDPTQPVDWIHIAHQSGYYDQAHFANELKAFLGHSPTDYLRLRRQLHAANPEVDRLLPAIPIE